MAQLSQEQIAGVARMIQHYTEALGVPVDDVADFCGIEKTRFRMYATGSLAEITAEDFDRLNDNIGELVNAETADIQQGSVPYTTYREKVKQ